MVRKKLKIAIILGAYSIGTRPLDFWFNNIWISSRGLTGTDLCFVKTASELQKLGHEVHLFTVHAQPHHKPDSWEGVKLYNYEDRLTAVDDSFDCIISLNEPDVFRGMPTKPFKIVWQMLNDFPFCIAGWEDVIDLGLGVCEQHTDYLKKLTSKPEKWETLSLGCTPEWYEDKRVPGRVVWCSSADRGLHWLLSQWPQIKAAVPYATLRIFYHFNYGNLSKIEPDSKTDHPHLIEMGQRIRYMQHAISKMKHLGVEHVGSVSREQMANEFSEASVFAFSCDTVAFSEGFSVSTLEAHASFTVPVMTDKDCLGSIYKDSGAIMINGTLKDHLPEFTSSVIKALTDKEFADATISKCRQFAKEHTWENIAGQIEGIVFKKLNIEQTLKKRLESKFSVYEVCDEYKSDCHCGPGSTLRYTESIRKNLRPFLNKHNITSIFDCPCGDFNWMSKVDLSNIDYLGGDVVLSQVELNRKLYPNQDFMHIDITEDKLPLTYDLLFCRDCLFHFSEEDKRKALRNFVNSDMKYIMISNYHNCTNNINLVTGDFKEINWEIAPFNFPKPIDIIDDSDETDTRFSKRVMNLYSKAQIASVL